MQSMQTASANRLVELRKQSGLLRSQIAGALRVDQSTLWRWEHGATIPDHKKLELAKLFGVSPAYLMGWSDAREAA
jgi:transcriptional regulator with XRE-family HTH domain